MEAIKNALDSDLIRWTLAAVAIAAVPCILLSWVSIQLGAR